MQGFGRDRGLAVRTVSIVSQVLSLAGVVGRAGCLPSVARRAKDGPSRPWRAEDSAPYHPLLRGKLPREVLYRQPADLPLYCWLCLHEN